MTLLRSSAKCLLGIALLFGCDKEKVPSSSGPSMDGMDGATDLPEALRGRSFLSTSVQGYTLAGDTQVFLSFRDGLSASAGCNQMGADTFDVRAGRLEVGDLSMTEIGCEAPLHEQDEWLAGLLQASPEVALEGNELTLTDEDSTLVLLDREVADPDRPLRSTRWEVNGLIEGMGVGWGSTSPQPTLEFGDDGVLTIVTPCARGTADFEVQGSSIEVLDVALPEASCPPNENAGQVDAHMRAVLAPGSLRYEIEARRLTLSRGDIGLALRAAEAGDDGPTCTDLAEAFELETTQVRHCTEDVDCGVELEGTSCGCTRNWVARADANLDSFWALLEDGRETQCAFASLGSSCDCPPAEGFACVDEVCTWNYVSP